jgi:hypothetical protein
LSVCHELSRSAFQYSHSPALPKLR